MKKKTSNRARLSPARDQAPSAALRPIAWCVMLACCDAALANPTGAQIVNGVASFARPDARTLNVTNSPGTIINWQGFSIGAGELTRFTQQSASSAVLNRVVGADISQIHGTLSSNGRVFLINPQGIMIGAGAVIDTAGFVGSTLNMLDRDFIAGKLKFEGGGQGLLRNEGTIRSGGDIFLVGPNIENSGLILSEGGSVVLAAGRSVTITSPNLDGVQFALQAPSDSALNLGTIEAKSAVGMFADTLRHSGDIRAGSMSVDSGGRVVLSARKDATVDAGATISASGAKGGDVTIRSGGTTLVSGTIDATGSASKGGTVQVLGNLVGLTGKARIDASGETGGGTILVGGDNQGKNIDVQNAWRTFVGPDAFLKADAIQSGNGGKVIVWADDINRYYGSISVRGGAQSGNGGFVEVSGKRYLDFRGTVDGRAPHGQLGTLLLDPNDINIVAADTADEDTDRINIPVGGGNIALFSEATAAAVSEITIPRLRAALNSLAVVIDTQSGGGAPGDINFNAPLDISGIGGPKTLSLVADRNINFNAGISGAGAADILNLTLQAGRSNAAGVTNIRAGISLGGGLLDSNTAGTRVVTFDSGASAISNVSAFNAGTLNFTGGTATLNGATTAATLNMSGGSLLGSGNVTVTSAFSRSAGTINTTGGLSITQAANPLNTGGAITARSITLTAVDGIAAGALTATDGRVVLSNTRPTADVVLTGNLDATNTGLGAGTAAIDVSSARSIEIRNADLKANTSGGVRLQAGSDIAYDNTAVAVTTNVLTAPGNVSLTATNGRIYRTGPTAGNQNFLNVTGANVTLNALTQIMTPGSITASGPVSLTATAGGIDTRAGALIVSAGNAALSATGGISAGAMTASNGRITLSSTGANADVELNGTLQATNAVLPAATAAIGVSSGRSIVIRNLDVRANTQGGVTLQAGSDIAYDNTAVAVTTNVLTAPGNVSLSATNGRIYRTGPTVGNQNFLNIAGGNVTLGAATEITTPGTVTATGSLSLIATAGGIDTRAGVMSAASGNVTLGATNGINAGAITAGNGRITLASSAANADVELFGTLQATNTGLGAGIFAIDVGSGHSLAVHDANIRANTSGGVRLQAGSDLFYDNTTAVNTTNVLSAVGNVALSSANTRIYRSGTAGGNQNFLNVSGGNVTLSGVTGITTPGTVTATGPLSLTTTAGAINTTLGLMSAASGNVTLSATNGINAGAITAGNGTITLTSSAANADVDLFGTLQATNTGLGAGTFAIDVGSGHNLAVHDANIRANISGGVRLQAGSDLFYDNTTAVTTTNVLTAVGNVTLSSANTRIYRSGIAGGNQNFLNVSGGSVTLDAVTGITTPGTVTATGPLSLTTTGGGINTTLGAMSAASGNVALTGFGIDTGAITAGNGTITLTSNGPNADVRIDGSLRATNTGLGAGIPAIDVSSGRSVAIGNADLVANTSGAVRVQAASDLFYDNTVVVNTTNALTAAGNVSLTSANTRIYRSGIAAGNQNFLNIAGANVTLSAPGEITNLGRTSATSNVTLNAGTAIGANGNPFGLGTIGGVVNASTTGAPGDIYLNGTSSLPLGALSTDVTSTQVINVQVTGAASDITVNGAVNTNDNIALDSGRDILFAGGSSVAANSLSLAGAGTARFNAGTVTIGPALTSTIPISVAGATVNLSELNVTTGAVTVTDGQVVVSGDVNSASGTINLTGTGVSPTLSVGGNLNLGAGSVLGLDLRGTNFESYGRIEVGGTATLGGTLNVTTSGGFNPATNDPFQIMTYGSHIGDFATRNFPDLFTYTPVAGLNDYSLQVTAAPNIWTGLALDGNWATGGNWRDLAAPTAAQVALIPDVNGAGVTDTITVSTAGQAAGRLVSSENLAVTSGALTLGAGNSTVSALVSVSGGTLTANGPLAANTLTISAGTLNGTGAVTANTVNWSGTSTISGGGSLNVNTLLAMSGAGAVHILGGGRTINNSGAATLAGGGVLRGDPGGSTFNNSGGFTIADDSSVTNNGGPIAFVNSGPLTKSGGLGTSAFAANLTNSGTVNVDSGTLNLSGTSTHTTGTVNVAFGTTLQLSGNTHTFNAGSTLTGLGDLAVTGGTANVNGTYGLIHGITVSGGTANFAPTSGAITNNSLDISGGGIADFSVEVNPTTLNLSGNGTLRGTGNVTALTMNWTGNGTVSGTGDLNVSTTLDMSGAGAVHTIAGGRTINNGGAATLTGGELRGNPGGAAFNNNGTFTITDNSSVTNNGSAIAFGNAGALTKSGGLGTSAFAADLTNSGTVNVNSGALNLSGSSTHTTGTVSVVANSALQLSGGTHAFNAGSTLTGLGALSVTGGTANVNGTYGLVNAITVSGGTANFAPASGAMAATTLDISGGGIADFSAPLTTATINLGGNGTLRGTGEVTAATLNWTGSGTISGTGALNVNTTLAMSGAAAVHAMALGRTINNSGAATLTGGELRGNPGGANFNNIGTFTITDDSSVSNNGSAIAFMNTGTLTKSGAGTSIFAAALTNPPGGTVNANAGTFRFDNFPSNAGTVNIASGASLSTNNSNLANTGMIGGEGTLNLTGATLTNTGTLRPGAASGDTTGTLSITGNLIQGGAGQLDVELGGIAAGDFDVLAVSGTATLAGTINVSTAGVYTATAGHTFNVLTAAGTRTGTFGTINRTFANSLVPNYSSTVLELAIGSTTLNSWIIDGDGLWTTATNWSLGHVPTAGEQVEINRPVALFNVTIPAGTFSVDLLNSNENIVIAGGAAGSFTLANASTINAALSMSSGRLQGAGLLTVNGPLALTGGTIASTAGVRVNNTTTVSAGAPQITGTLITDTLNMTGGSLGIATGGVLGLAGGAASTISAAALTNAGTLRLSGAGNVLLENGATLTNSDTLEIQTNAGFLHTTGPTPTFTNTGTLMKSAGAGASGIGPGISLINSGVLDAQTGVIAYASNSTFSDGTRFTGAGANQVTGSATFNGTITSANLSLESGTFGGTAILDGTTGWAAGTIAGAYTIPGTGVFNVTGAGAKSLSNTTLINDGVVNIQPGAAIRLYDGVNFSTLNNNGTLNIDAGGFPLFSQAATQDGNAVNAGIVNVNTSGAFETRFSNTASGRLNVNGASTTLSLQNGQALAGTIAINDPTATLWVSEIHGAPASFNAATISGNGTVLVTGGGFSPVANFSDVTAANATLSVGNLGTVNVNGPTTFGNLIVSGGRLDGGAALSVGGNLTFSGGTIANTGGVTVAGTTSVNLGAAPQLSGMLTAGAFDMTQGTLDVTSTGVLNLTAPGAKSITGNSVVLNNAGLVRLAGNDDLALDNGATFNNTGRFDFQSDANIQSTAGALPFFANSGTVSKSGGAGISIIGLGRPFTFDNSGTLDAQTGILLFNSNNTFNDGTQFTGAGATFVMGDSTFNGTITSANLNLASGTYTGSATLAGTTKWSGGTIAGNVTVPAGATLDVTGASPKNLSGATATLTNQGVLNIGGDGALTVENGGSVTNNATATWNSSSLIYLDAGSTLTNNAAGTLTLNATTADSGIFGLGTLQNNGLLRSIASGIRTMIGAIFNNRGTVSVQGGTLQLSGGGTDTGAYIVDAGAVLEFGGGTRDLNAGSSLGGPGALAVTGGELNVNTPMTLANRVELTGIGVLGGSGDLLLSGPFLLGNSAAITGSGVLTTSGPTTLTPGSGGVAKDWVNTGTVNMADGAGLTFFGVAPTLTNRGTFNFPATGSAPIMVASGSGTIQNEGIFNKVSPDVQTIGSGFTNTASGTLNITAGTLSVSALDANAGLITLANGAILTTHGSNGIVNTGTIAGNGTIDLAGRTLTNSGWVKPGASPGALSVNGDYVQSPAGTLAIEIGGMTPGVGHDVLAVSGTASLAGTLAVDLVRGFTPVTGDTFNFMTYSSHTGDFTSIALPPVAGSQAVPTASAYEVALLGAPAAPVTPVVPIVDSGRASSALQTFTDSAVRPLADQFVSLREGGERLELEKPSSNAICR